MINNHTGRRIGFHTGKEEMPKYKYNTSSIRKKASKKFRCRICGNKYVGNTMIEDVSDKHGRVFYCKKCYNKENKNSTN